MEFSEVRQESFQISLSLISFPPGARVWPNSSRNIQKIVNMTMLSGPPAKSQLSGALYRAYQKQPTGGCTNEEVALSNQRLLHSGAVGQTTKEVHAMSTTTQRLSSLLVATMFIV